MNGQSGEERWNVTLSQFVPEGIDDHVLDPAQPKPASSDTSYEYDAREYDARAHSHARMHTHARTLRRPPHAQVRER